LTQGSKKLFIFGTQKSPIFWEPNLSTSSTNFLCADFRRQKKGTFALVEENPKIINKQFLVLKLLAPTTNKQLSSVFFFFEEKTNQFLAL